MLYVKWTTIRYSQKPILFQKRLLLLTKTLWKINLSTSELLAFIYSIHLGSDQISPWSTLGSQISIINIKKECYFKKNVYKIFFISLLQMVIIIIQYFIMTKFTLQLIWTEILFFPQSWTCCGKRRLGYACSFWNCAVVIKWKHFSTSWKIGLMIL